jgi:hypothetical protein
VWSYEQHEMEKGVRSWRGIIVALNVKYDAQTMIRERLHISDSVNDCMYNTKSSSVAGLSGQV